MGEPLLSVREVSRSLRIGSSSITILAPVSFELSAATIVALAGPSGSGKTTLCNILVGWERADSGSVEWASSGREHWDRIAVAPQRLGLFDWLTVGENIALPAWTMRRDVPPDRLDRVTQQLEISHLLHRRPLELSLGEQQRAAIARALLGRPALAVLDEPTGHQDEKRTALVVAADHVIRLERQ
jgi:ABC-type lipoprotein export system ATPase subunit